MTYIRSYIGHWFGDPLRMVNIENAVTRLAFKKKLRTIAWFFTVIQEEHF